MQEETPNLRAEDGAWDVAAAMAVVCERIAGGESVRQICADPAMPPRYQIYRWMWADPALRLQYLDACRIRTFHYNEEIVEIADECRKGIKTVVKETANGTFTETTEVDLVERAKLQIDTRKWTMARMNRVDFGDRVTNEHVGANGGPIQSVNMSREEFREIAKGLIDEV